MNKIIVLAIFFLISCKESSENRIYKNAGTEKVTGLKKSKNLDTLIRKNEFYDNGNLKSQNQFYYNTKLKISGDLNQKIVFSKKGDTLHDLSFYYTINLPDTIPVGKSMHRLKFHEKLLNERLDVAMCVKNSYNGEVLIDSFFNGNLQSNKLNFGTRKDSLGLRLVDGFILQQLTKREHVKDSMYKMYLWYKKCTFENMFTLKMIIKFLGKR